MAGPRYDPHYPRFGPGRRRADKYMVPWEHVDNRLIYARDGWRCTYCGNKVAQKESCANGIWIGKASTDHVVPISLGGSQMYSNLVTSCEPCNYDKGNDLDKVDIAILLRLVREVE